MTDKNGMKWDKDAPKPDQGGWYWLKSKLEKNGVEMVFVSGHSVDGCGWNYSVAIYDKEYEGCFWMGPIEEPNWGG